MNQQNQGGKSGIQILQRTQTSLPKGKECGQAQHWQDAELLIETSLGEGSRVK